MTDSISLMINADTVKVPANADPFNTTLDSLQTIANPLMPWIEKNEQQAYSESFTAGSNSKKMTGKEYVETVLISLFFGCVGAMAGALVGWRFNKPILGVSIFGGLGTLVVPVIVHLSNLSDTKKNAKNVSKPYSWDVNMNNARETVEKRGKKLNEYIDIQAKIENIAKVVERRPYLEADADETLRLLLLQRQLSSFEVINVEKEYRADVTKLNTIIETARETKNEETK